MGAISPQVEGVGDAELKASHERLVAVLRVEALATASQTPGQGALLEAGAALACRILLTGALVASEAAGAAREVDLDDVQQACVYLQTFGLAGVGDSLQEFCGFGHEVAEVVAGPFQVVNAAEVIVRDAQGLELCGSCEHGERAFGGAVERAFGLQVVLVAAGAKGDIAEVLLHVADLVEEQLEGSGVLEGELVVAVQDGEGISADFFADSYEREVVVGRALDLSVLEYGQSHLF